MAAWFWSQLNQQWLMWRFQFKSNWRHHTWYPSEAEAIGFKEWIGELWKVTTSNKDKDIIPLSYQPSSYPKVSQPTDWVTMPRCSETCYQLAAQLLEKRFLILCFISFKKLSVAPSNLYTRLNVKHSHTLQDTPNLPSGGPCTTPPPPRFFPLHALKKNGNRRLSSTKRFYRKGHISNCSEAGCPRSFGLS